MRFFRNPIVTGILTLIAAAMVFYRLILPYLGPGISVPFVAKALLPDPARSRAVAAANALRDQLKEAATSPDQGLTVDRDYLEARFAKWVATPKRDPFLVLGVDPKDKELLDMLEPSPIAKWKFNGICDQTGGRWAVINNVPHQVGDEIAGFKIIRIESEEVWFQGPKRKERLGLLQHGPAILPNPVFKQPDESNAERLKR
jgi:hypothetical protein